MCAARVDPLPDILCTTIERARVFRVEAYRTPGVLSDVFMVTADEYHRLQLFCREHDTQRLFGMRLVPVGLDIALGPLRELDPTIARVLRKVDTAPHRPVDADDTSLEVWAAEVDALCTEVRRRHRAASKDG